MRKFNSLIAIMIAIATIGICHISHAQMEKRASELFDEKAFLETKPKIGEKAPSLKLKSLEDTAVSLSDYQSSNLIVIKAGYT